MRDPFLRPFCGNVPTTESWLNRVRENLGQLLIPSHFKPSSANGAPIHLLKFDKSQRPARSQGASLITHAAVFAAVLLLLANTKGVTKPPFPGGTTPLGPYKLSAPLIRSLTSAHPTEGGGRGGDQNPIPATKGNLPPLSSIVLVKPTLPQNEHPQLPEPPTIFDPSAAPVLSPTDNIGLPWMPDDTNSPGPGKNHGIGSKDGTTIGDKGDGPAGYNNQNSLYKPAAVQPACAYCPYPTYTDEARHGKVQGAVTLMVLVGADGRAQDIRIVKGIGFGLDERAVETVRSWKFIPARDGAKRSVTAWVTVEAVFRLF
ncbi:MAG TPA: TonB family protein [Candidatus Acidoferrum sp.]|jgi:periplasmic protein TonB|nr:TonB family protein [Candidatus Acidoferrum sp.]